MKIKIVIGVIVAVLLLIAGNWFYVSQEAYAPFLEDNNEPGEASVGKTFAQLMGMGQSLECTYEYNDGKNVSSGTMYMAEGGERIRGDFNFIQSEAGPMPIHMVRADGYSYIWSSAMPQGIKIQVTAENRTQLFSGADAHTDAMNDNTQYKCVAWRADPSKFAVPTNVSFIDTGDSNKKMMGAPKIGEATIQAEGTATTDIKAMQCAACDQAGPARDQCRQALGC